MVINFLRNDNTLTVSPVGRLDSATATEFENSVMAEITSKPDMLTVDFSEVDFVSSKGLRVLVSLYRAMGGNKLVLAHTNESIREVLRLSGLMKFFVVQ